MKMSQQGCIPLLVPVESLLSCLFQSIGAACIPLTLGYSSITQSLLTRTSSSLGPLPILMALSPS